MRKKSLFQLIGIITLELFLLYLIFVNFEKIFVGIGSFARTMSPLIVGVAIAYLLNPPVSKIQRIIKVKNGRLLAVVLVFLFILISLFLIGNLIGPLILKNFQDLLTFLPTVSDLEWATFEAINRFATWLTFAATYLFTIASGALRIVMALIIAFYLLWRKDSVHMLTKRSLQTLLGTKIYPIVATYASNSDRIFYKFVGAQLLDATILWILATIVLLIIGVPYALAFGFLIGICNMIPIFGSIVATLITVLVTYFTSGVTLAVITLIALLILQQIDANIVSPKITGEAVGLKPLLIIFAIFIGGHYFGIIGIFIGVPVMAILKMFLEDFILIKERKNY